MTSLRRLTCDDLFAFNNVNLDILTETYNLPFYLQVGRGGAAGLCLVFLGLQSGAVKLAQSPPVSTPPHPAQHTHVTPTNQHPP